MKLRLRYPATAKNALDHAELAVKVAAEEFDARLDYTPQSLETLDVEIESLREEGLDGEAAAEVLQEAAAIERQVRSDFERISREGFFMIRCVAVPNNINVGAGGPLLNPALAPLAGWMARHLPPPEAATLARVAAVAKAAQ